MDEQAMTETANELYWHSDRSVNQIAEDLELSKGHLYELVRPKPTGMLCPMCGAEADYPNRTAKERGRVLCSECDFEGSEDELVLPASEHADFGDQVAAAASSVSIGPRRLFWGAVCLGAAAGLILFQRRRD